MSSTLKSSKKGPSKEALFLARCRRDFKGYGKTVLRIATKSGDLVPFSINAAQTIVDAKIEEQKKARGFVKVIVLKARQEGVSTYTAGRFFRGLHLWPNRNALVMAHELQPGRALFTIYERFYRNLDESLKPQTRSAKLERQLWFDQPSDSKLTVDTANNKNAGRGSTLHYLHASELAFWENAADTWLSVSQAVADKGSEVIIESTPNGVGNFFHQMWLDAEAGNNDYVPIFLPWWIHEEYTTEVTEDQITTLANSDDPFEREALDEGLELEGKKHKLTPGQLWWRRMTIKNKCGGDERVFRQEYPSNARECFLVSGNCFFDEEALTRYDEATSPPLLRGDLSKNAKGAVVFTPGERGYLRVWEAPRGDGLYVIGADTASGRQVAARDTSFSDPEGERGGRDFSCAWVYDLTHRKYVAKLHGRMHPEEFANKLASLGYFYASEGTTRQRPALIGVEKNHSSGETVLHKLKAAKYPNLYYSRQFNRRREGHTPVLGWVTTVETRMPMLDAFAEVLREMPAERKEGKKTVHTLPCKDTIRECFTFVRGDDGKPEAQEGCHDDRVIAAAICLQIGRYATSSNKQDFAPATATQSATGLGFY